MTTFPFSEGVRFAAAMWHLVLPPLREAKPSNKR